jgi:hypothetical protein
VSKNKFQKIGEDLVANENQFYKLFCVERLVRKLMVSARG